MYKVMGMPMNRTLRVLWMLEELGQPYDFVSLMPRSDEARAVNPSGKVPVLDDDGTIITDSVGICTYLADKHQALTAAAGTKERARQDGYTLFAIDEIEGALWNMSKHKFLLPKEQRLEAMHDLCRAEFAKAMDHLEGRIGDGPYIMGEMFTVPDIILGHCARWAGVVKFEVPAGKVADYFARVAARPALATVLERHAA